MTRLEVAGEMYDRGIPGEVIYGYVTSGVIVRTGQTAGLSSGDAYLFEKNRRLYLQSGSSHRFDKMDSALRLYGNVSHRN